MKIDNNRKEREKQPVYRNNRSVRNPGLYQELKEYQEAGILLWLNGRPSNSFRIANCVREENGYMRDYHVNQKNEICGISFDRVRRDREQSDE